MNTEIVVSVTWDGRLIHIEAGSSIVLTRDEVLELLDKINSMIGMMPVKID